MVCFTLHIDTLSSKIGQFLPFCFRIAGLYEYTFSSYYFLI